MPADGSRVRAWLLPATLATAAFGICYALARAFADANVFRYLDVLFDTDAAWFLQGFADGSGTGTGWGARSMVHPNVANLVNPPIRALGGACSALGICDASPAGARASLALFVSPLAAATEVLFVFLAIRRLTGSQVQAALVATLNIALLPTLVFGAIPESFALTGAAFAVLFYLTSRVATGERVPAAWWVLTGAAITSLTLPNAWLFALAFVVAHSAGRWISWPSIQDGFRVSSIAIVCTALIAMVVGLGGYRALADYQTGVEQLAEVRAPREELREGQWSGAATSGLQLGLTGAFVNVPRAFGDSLLPPRAYVNYAASLKTHRPISQPPVQADFRQTSLNWGTFVTLAALAGALTAGLTIVGRRRILFQVAAALLAGNWAFHSVFGVELFLYAKHWSVALTVALAGWLEVRRPFPWLGAGVLLILIGLAVMRDIDVLSHLLGVLAL